MVAATESPPAGAGVNPAHGSMSRERRWALRWSYVCLLLFGVIFLMPPV